MNDDTTYHGATSQSEPHLPTPSLDLSTDQIRYQCKNVLTCRYKVVQVWCKHREIQYMILGSVVCVVFTLDRSFYPTFRHTRCPS